MPYCKEKNVVNEKENWHEKLFAVKTKQKMKSSLSVECLYSFKMI